MGSIEFEDEEGNIRTICLEGGVIPFGDDSDMEAFERWRETEQGRADLGGDNDDDSNSEHYLSDKYPWNPETETRGDEDDYVDYCFYEKCRYNCYRQFWYTGKHDCCICGVISCSQCARQGGRTCASDDCKEWICGNHQSLKCQSCTKLDVKEEKNKEDVSDVDKKPAAKRGKST